MKRLISALVLSVFLITPLAWSQASTTPYASCQHGVDFTRTPTSPEYEMGIPCYGNEGFFLYAKASEAINAGEWVFIDESNLLTLADTTESASEPSRAGIAAATAAANDYVWVWIGVGAFEGIVSNSLSADTALTTTGTAGDAGSGGDELHGCKNIDAGVTDTRVTVQCADFIYTN